MPNEFIKISELPSATALTGQELIALVQNGETRQSSLMQWTTGTTENRVNVTVAEAVQAKDWIAFGATGIYEKITTFNVTAGLSAATVFESSTTEPFAIANLSTHKALVLYGANSKVLLRTITSNSGVTTVSSPLVLANGVTSSADLTVMNSHQALIAYSDPGESNYGKVALIEINNDTATIIATVTFKSAATSLVKITTLAPNKALVVFKDSVNSVACVITCSGDILTTGANKTIKSSSTGYSLTAVENDKVVVVHTNAANTAYEAQILNVYESTITPVTPYVIPSTNSSNSHYPGHVARISNNKVLMTYCAGSTTQAAIPGLSGPLEKFYLISVL